LVGSSNSNGNRLIVHRTMSLSNGHSYVETISFNFNTEPYVAVATSSSLFRIETRQSTSV